jgi:succinate-acetate transporter protein
MSEHGDVPVGNPDRPGGTQRNVSRGAGFSADVSSTDGALDGDSKEAWAGRGRIVLTPIAPPVILGLFGFAVTTFMVASLLAGWWGTPSTAAPVLAPLAIFFGGLAEFLAAMWAYKARDAVATAVFGTWGTFWLAWGMLVLLTAGGFLPPGTLTGRALGFWFIGLGLVTAFEAAASFVSNMVVFTVLVLLAAGAMPLAAAYIGGLTYVAYAAGWVLVASSAAGFYTGFAVMLQSAWGGKTILPLGTLTAAGNIPGRKAVDPLSYPQGMPGAKVGD